MLPLLLAALLAQPDINWSTIDGGGGTSSSSTVSLRATIAQPDAASVSGMSSASYTVTGGFWVTNASGNPCPADFNTDGAVDLFDYLDFINAFSANLPQSDFNRDTAIDLFDYLDFVDAFAAGC